MKTHITTLNNMAGTASLAHRRVLKVAQSIGCHEMGFSNSAASSSISISGVQ